MELRDIKGYEGKYMISDDGQVYSVWAKRFMKLETNWQGYKRVSLFKDDKKKHFSVHRLVAEAFIPNPDNLPEVNHKNEDKGNNKVENLEWCDRHYNSVYGTRIERVVSKSNRQTYQYDLDGNLIAVWPSQSEASRQLGISRQNITKAVNNQRKTAGGFIFTSKPIDK